MSRVVFFGEGEFADGIWSMNLVSVAAVVVVVDGLS